VEQNRKAGQNPPRVVEPTEEEDDYIYRNRISSVSYRY